ncbi:LPS translocon maturation chaperone LptM [Ferrimonas futtsuensis]|nr:lipoprotein [Ferrimonas futtsuensis]
MSRLSTALILGMLLCACGQKGPLELPQQEQVNPPPADTQQQPSQATQEQ